MEYDLEALGSELKGRGYVIVRNVIDPAVVSALNADLDPCFAAVPFCDGEFYGRSTKRFGALLNRSPHAEAFVRHPLALALATHLLGPWCDRILLNLTQAVEIHPGALAQYPHRDEDMWGGPKGGGLEYLVNVIWPLTPFHAGNGATRLWAKPGDDGAGRADSGEYEGDGAGVPGSTIFDEADAIYAEVAPGDVLLFAGSTLHAGSANHAILPRRGLIISYCLGWLRPFENQWLVYPPGVAQGFDPELAALIGYAQHRPNLGNVEGQCPSRLLRGDTASLVAATDALREEQADALRSYVAGQRSGPVAA